MQGPRSLQAGGEQVSSVVLVVVVVGTVVELVVDVVVPGTVVEVVVDVGAVVVDVVTVVDEVVVVELEVVLLSAVVVVVVEVVGSVVVVVVVWPGHSGRTGGSFRTTSASGETLVEFTTGGCAGSRKSRVLLLPAVSVPSTSIGPLACSCVKPPAPVASTCPLTLLGVSVVSCRFWPVCARSLCQVRTST
jgi:hypothetical protein